MTMKTKILSLLLMVSGACFSQQLVTTCFDSNDNPIAEVASSYCLTGKKILKLSKSKISGVTDSVELFVDTVKAFYSKTRTLKFVKYYDSQGNLQGDYLEFFPSGELKAKGSYKDGVKSGITTNFYVDGGKQARTERLYSDSMANVLMVPPEVNFKIIDYWDSTGNQLIENGNGFCECYFLSGRKEVGRVVNGLRDSVWSEYLDDNIILRENYDNGKLIEGIRFDHTDPRKYTLWGEQPEFVGGYEALIRVIKKNMKYPKNARRKRIDGTVYVSFIVTKTGDVTEVATIKGICPECDREAERVIKLLNTWHPGKQRGHPVFVRYVIPLKFKLN